MGNINAPVGKVYRCENIGEKFYCFEKKPHENCYFHIDSII